MLGGERLAALVGCDNARRRKLSWGALPYQGPPATPLPTIPIADLAAMHPPVAPGARARRRHQCLAATLAPPGNTPIASRVWALASGRMICAPLAAGPPTATARALALVCSCCRWSTSRTMSALRMFPHLHALPSNDTASWQPTSGEPHADCRHERHAGIPDTIARLNAVLQRRYASGISWRLQASRHGPWELQPIAAGSSACFTRHAMEPYATKSRFTAARHQRAGSTTVRPDSRSRGSGCSPGGRSPASPAPQFQRGQSPRQPTATPNRCLRCAAR